jgi:hypothetical protein
MRGRIVGFGDSTRYYIGEPGREKQVSKTEFDEIFKPVEDLGGDGSGLIAWHKPIESDALAVHPKQIQEAMARNARHGLYIDYNPADGRPILRDRDQRRRLMKIEKCHDNSGGYGDG